MYMLWLLCAPSWVLLAELIAAAAAGSSGRHEEDAGGDQCIPTNGLLERIVCLFHAYTAATRGWQWGRAGGCLVPLAVVEAVGSSLGFSAGLWTPFVSEHNVRRYQVRPAPYGRAESSWREQVWE